MRKVETSIASFGCHAEDAVQEALLRALDNGVDCSATPWLKTVARRVAIDRTRRTREVASTGEPELDHFITPTDRTPEDIILGNEAVDAIRAAVAALPPRYRNALIAYAEEQEIASVARRFGASQNATTTLLCRARARLRQELDRVGYAFGLIWVRLPSNAGESAAVAAAICLAATAIIVTNPPAAPNPPIPTAIVSSAVVSALIPETTQQPTATESTSSAEEASPEQVEEAEPEEVQVARYAVGACRRDENRSPLGIEVELVDDTSTPSLIVGLAERLPEPLRNMEASRCQD